MPKNFSQVVADQRRGIFGEQAGDAFAALVQEVNTSRKPGEFIVKFKLQPNNNTGYIVITDEIIVKAPKIDRAADFMFASTDGTLSRNDPNQPELPGLRAVDKPDREVVYVEVDRSTGEVLTAPATNTAAVAAVAPQDAKQLAQVAAAMSAAKPIAPVTLAPTPGEVIAPPPDAAAA